MEKFIETRDKAGKISTMRTPCQGDDLLQIPELNKGSAFSLDERRRFGLMGKLPISIETSEQQVARLPNAIAIKLYLMEMIGLIGQQMFLQPMVHIQCKGS